MCLHYLHISYLKRVMIAHRNSYTKRAINKGRRNISALRRPSLKTMTFYNVIASLDYLTSELNVLLRKR